MARKKTTVKFNETEKQADYTTEDASYFEAGGIRFYNEDTRNEVFFPFNRIHSVIKHEAD